MKIIAMLTLFTVLAATIYYFREMDKKELES